jgi:hypothetical protein
MASHTDTKVDCSKVYIKSSTFATPENQFDGAFAFVPFKEGESSAIGNLLIDSRWRNKKSNQQPPHVQLLKATWWKRVS